MTTEPDIFEPYEKLISIEICGEIRQVPENNTLLRCFQFLALDSISIGEFCWNGTCTNCQVWLDNGSAEKPVLSCRTEVQENMRIVKMSEEIKGVNILDPETNF
ncbi:MAG TPA: 2Fe-2S iron-sulfur cluster-binding protein [Pyrinomonadaceae bacterium]